MKASEDEAVLLRRVAAMVYEAEYDVGVGLKVPRLIGVSHDGILPQDLRPLALRGLIAFSERTERFAQSPRRVVMGTVTAAGRHAAGLKSPPRATKHRPKPQEED